MDEESVGRQWAGMSYEEAVGDLDNRIDFGDRTAVRSFMRDAIRIFRETLGADWLKRERDPRRRGGYLLLDDAEGELETFAEASERLTRLFDLAVELHDARGIRGFDHLVPDLRHRSLPAALAELRAVNHMMRAGEDAWFIDPNAVQGKSYDAVMVLDGINVAVEVKVKEPQPVERYRPRLIENALNSARKQLPASGPSLIYMQVSSPWTDDELVMASIDKTIQRWLMSTGRVNGVRVMTERTFEREPAGVSRLRGSIYISNPNVHQVVPQL